VLLMTAWSGNGRTSAVGGTWSPADGRADGPGGPSSPLCGAAVGFCQPVRSPAVVADGCTSWHPATTADMADASAPALPSKQRRVTRPSLPTPTCSFTSVRSWWSQPTTDRGTLSLAGRSLTPGQADLRSQICQIW